MPLHEISYNFPSVFREVKSKKKKKKKKTTKRRKEKRSEEKEGKGRRVRARR